MSAFQEISNITTSHGFAMKVSNLYTIKYYPQQIKINLKCIWLFLKLVFISLQV